MSSRRSTGVTPGQNKEGVLAPSPVSSRLSSPPLMIPSREATSQVRSQRALVSPTNTCAAGEAPVAGSASDVAQSALERAVQSTSRGVHISPSRMRSAGAQRIYQQETSGHHIPYPQGTKMYAPQPIVPYPSRLMGQNTVPRAKRELLFSQANPLGYIATQQRATPSPLVQHQDSRAPSVVHKIEPPRPTVSPLRHVSIAIGNIFQLEGITSLREKEEILRCVDTEFQTINTSMGVEAMLPHQNLPMYLDTLKSYMKERADDALHDYVDVEQELPQIYRQETLPVEREITPVKDANIEIALGRMAAPR